LILRFSAWFACSERKPLDRSQARDGVVGGFERGGCGSKTDALLELIVLKPLRNAHTIKANGMIGRIRVEALAVTDR
jgi:hypothetical protein